MAASPARSRRERRRRAVLGMLGVCGVASVLAVVSAAAVLLSPPERQTASRSAADAWRATVAAEEQLVAEISREFLQAEAAASQLLSWGSEAAPPGRSVEVRPDWDSAIFIPIDLLGVQAQVQTHDQAQAQTQAKAKAQTQAKAQAQAQAKAGKTHQGNKKQSSKKGQKSGNAQPVLRGEPATAAKRATGKHSAGADEGTCGDMEANAEYEGAVVRWGAQNIVDSAAACCEQCRQHATAPPEKDKPGCTSWIYCDAESGCGDTKARVRGECWLKTHEEPWLREARMRGEGIGWTSGVLYTPADRAKHAAGSEQRKHTRALEWLRSFGDAAPPPPSARACGSPAVDGYAHVDVGCLERSPTAVAWRLAALEAMERGAALTSAPYGHTTHSERHVSLDGLAVAWGLTHNQPTAEACAAACLAHTPGPGKHGPFKNLPCNVWVWCPDEKCFEPDAHSHTRHNCWLKFSELPESPEVNQRGVMAEHGFAQYRTRHKDAPEVTQWVSGTVLPKGLAMTNGTWGPRANW